MKILITGSSGLIGSVLIPHLEKMGHEVWRLGRAAEQIQKRELFWNPEKEIIHLENAPPLDAVIHLVGENIAGHRWSKKQKQKIRDSRVKGTELLVSALSALKKIPEIMISASATGYYGNRGQELLDENSSPGKGFLADTCQEWENAAKPIQQRGTRLVLLRTGMVLSTKGGALERLLPIFKKGLGGPLGNGRQYTSWIALDDLVSIILFALKQKNLSGPLNAVSPKPITNRQFAKTLGHVLERPAFLAAPALALRLIMGNEMANELLLASQFVEPKKLLRLDFSFRYPELESALKHCVEG